MNEFSVDRCLMDPAVFAENRLPARADFLAYGSEDELAAGESSLRLCLDGVWSFHYANNPSAAPEGFWREGADIDGWDTIRVPAHIQMEGHDRPAYVNTQYPWDALEELRPGQVPTFFNPVADYVRDFVLPERFGDMELRLRFEGVESGFACWLNGQYLGYSEDSFTPAEFSLGSALRPGRNRLAVRVFKWTPGSWFEDQDFYRFSGFFRSVYLLALPGTALLDLSVVPELSEDFSRGRVRVDAKLRGEGSVRLRLLREGRELCAAEAPVADGCARAELKVESPALWSAEDPALYSLRLQVLDGAGALTQVTEQKLGFRRFEIQDGLMLLNGRRLVFKGVNRHDFSSLRGRVPDREELLRDIRTMKRHNINAIRTCHYPNQSDLYALCDEYGLYVMDECNMETHGSWDAYLRKQVEADFVIPKDHFEFAPLLLDRVRSLYQRDKNHACVLIWSCGNESYGGGVIREMSRLLHRLDPTRLVHYEGITWDPSYPDTSDIESRMYTPAAQIEAFLAEHTEKPLICCEYSHAMGNSCGGLHKYTELTDRCPRYQGGFIWDYVDQSLWKKDRYGQWFQAYGGDSGERPTDYNFSGNGLVYGGDRAPSPKLQEVKFDYQNISLDFDDTGFTVRNRHLFLDTGRFDALAILLQDGVELRRESLKLPVPPLSEQRFPIPETMLSEMALRERAALRLGRALPEFALTLSFRLREDCLWARAGHEIAFGQKVWKREPAPFVCTEPLTVIRGKWNLGVRGAAFSAQFSAIRPGLTSYVYNGVEMIEQIPMPNFWRAPNDNDMGNAMPQRYAQWKIASLYITGKDPRAPLFPEVQRLEHSVRVSFPYFMPTLPASACTVCYEVFGDGTVETTLSYPGVEGLCDMPEFGMLFKLNADFDRFRFYGLGPEENYADRQRGARLGVYETTAAENLSRYLVPQECGNRCGVRWARVLDRRGRGLEFSGDELSVSVLPWTPHELENAAHPYELPPVHYTVVRIALQQMGVGGDDSWGARTLPEYLLPQGQDLCLRFRFRGV